MEPRPALLAIITAAAVGAAAVLASPARTQNAGGTPDIGAEPGNWGLAPFAAIPTLTLRPEDRTAIRSLEDKHLRERRAFEDKYEAELRELIRRQAQEREALRLRLSGPR
jgi:Spy/CpxP family protein refolding chaperone